MKPHQTIGYKLLATTAITTITSTRVYHGLRPDGTVIPSINYYELGGGVRQGGMESIVYSINCRASSASAARNLSRLVVDSFAGTSGTGMYGEENGFELSKTSLVSDGGLIPEPEDGIYNSPIDIRIVYPVSTVS